MIPNGSTARTDRITARLFRQWLRLYTRADGNKRVQDGAPMLTLLSAEACREERAVYRQGMGLARRSVVASQPKYLTESEIATLWLAPWDRDRYPGRSRIMRSIIPATYGALNHWRRGFRPLPKYAAEALLRAIEARCAEGARIMELLRASIAAAEARELDPKPWRFKPGVRGLGRRGQQGVAGHSSSVKE